MQRGKDEKKRAVGTSASLEGIKETIKRMIDWVEL